MDLFHTRTTSLLHSLPNCRGCSSPSSKSDRSAACSYMCLEPSFVLTPAMEADSGMAGKTGARIHESKPDSGGLGMDITQIQPAREELAGAGQSNGWLRQRRKVGVIGRV